MSEPNVDDARTEHGAVVTYERTEANMRSLNMGAHKLELVQVQELVARPRPPRPPAKVVRDANR